jgi:uroporphyrin-III C-methyltransferase
VTAALAAAADLRTSLTQRGVARSVTFVTPRVGEGEAPSGWASAVAAADTAVLYMAAGEAARVRDALVEAASHATCQSRCRERIARGLALARATLGEIESLVEARVKAPRSFFSGVRLLLRVAAALEEFLQARR